MPPLNPSLPPLPASSRKMIAKRRRFAGFPSFDKGDEEGLDRFFKLLKSYEI
jgi:hypothetical protein